MATTPTYGIQTTAELSAAVKKYLPYFITDVKVVGTGDSGEQLANFLAAVIRNTHYGLDFRFREGNPSDVQQVEHALKLFEVNNYRSPGPGAARTNVTLSLKTSALTVDTNIPQWSVVRTSGSPSIYGVVSSGSSIPAGSTEVSGLSIVQGRRYTAQAVGTGTGAPNQGYLITTRYIPKEFLVVYVNGVEIDRVNSLFSVDDTSLVYEARYDADGYLTIAFGDDIYGKSPAALDAITADWIVCQGVAGNFTMEDTEFDTIDGPLKSVVNVSQTASCTGGTNGPSIAVIKANAAPLQHTAGTIKRSEDAEAEAVDFAGVYAARASSEGSLINVYIMPDGGGTASTALINAVESDLQSKAMDGIEIDVYPLTTVPLLASMRVVLKQDRYRISRSVVSKMILDALRTRLSYTNVTIGRGTKTSDVSSLVEALDDNGLVDYVDLNQFMRYPGIDKSNSSSPDITNMTYTSSLSAGTYTITMFTPVTYFVAFNGSPLASVGTIGSVYDTGNGFKFIVGQVGDAFVLGDTYTIYVTSYAANITIQPDEYMTYRGDGDFAIDVVYYEEDQQ
jgi:hypothetical protein